MGRKFSHSIMVREIEPWEQTIENLAAKEVVATCGAEVVHFEREGAGFANEGNWAPACQTAAGRVVPTPYASVSMPRAWELLPEKRKCRDCVDALEMLSGHARQQVV